VILPLFNKFIPLEESELKTAIQNYAKEQNFALAGIFKIDASRRSTKSNAFFTGFGKFRRVALFDTLIQKHTIDELVSVLAHEIGHYKKKHFLKGMLLSIITTGLMLFVLSFFISNNGLFAAFRMQHLSIYASLIFFGFLYSPINFILSTFSNVISRKHEYEADKFAVLTYRKPQSAITALKKLTVDNLSNLTPHPLKIFLDYSHPPILKRISAIKKLELS
jgi:STE24 endopeptidase